MSKFLRLIFASLLVLAVCALSAMAQSTTTGAINGTVSNPNKEVVAGATVTAKPTQISTFVGVRYIYKF